MQVLDTMAMIHLPGSLGHDPSARNFGICVTAAPPWADAVSSNALHAPAVMSRIAVDKIAIVRNGFLMAVFSSGKTRQANHDGVFLRDAFPLQSICHLRFRHPVYIWSIDFCSCSVVEVSDRWSAAEG